MLAATLVGVCAFTIGPSAIGLATRPPQLPARLAAPPHLFESASTATPADPERSTPADPERAPVSERTGVILVTAPLAALYESRQIFQSLHDFGSTYNYKEIISHSASIADSKKLLLSRNARYSGLLDVLAFREGPLADAMPGVDAWLAINADEAELGAQLEAAKSAGIKRVFLLNYASKKAPAAACDAAALEKTLAGSGLEYSVMCAGPLLDALRSPVGLVLEEGVGATAEALGREDVFRFVVEALTLADAADRMWSLRPTKDLSQLKAMRAAGCSRRQEVEALLKGEITEVLAPKELTEEERAAKAAADTVTEAEAKAAKEEEYKRLFAEARKLGEETAKKKKYGVIALDIVSRRVLPMAAGTFPHRYEEEEDAMRRQEIMDAAAGKGSGTALFSGDDDDEAGGAADESGACGEMMVDRASRRGWLMAAGTLFPLVSFSLVAGDESTPPCNRRVTTVQPPCNHRVTTV